MIHNIKLVAGRYDALLGFDEHPPTLALIAGDRVFAAGDWIQIHRGAVGVITSGMTAEVLSVSQLTLSDEPGEAALGTISLQLRLLEPPLEDPPHLVAAMATLRRSDYVLATKYDDGDPQDHWAVGFFDGLTAPHYDPPRYNVVDELGMQFRSNGFRRVDKITLARGKWLLDHRKEIEQSGKSVWDFLTCPMAEVLPAPATPAEPEQPPETAIKLISHKPGGYLRPDDPTYPWKLYVNLRPPSFMQVGFAMLYGGSEEIVVRGGSFAALEGFLAEHKLYAGGHPRFRRAEITGPDNVTIPSYLPPGGVCGTEQPKTPPPPPPP